MRNFLRTAIVLFILLGSWAAPAPAAAQPDANLDTTADAVFGQKGSFITANFSSNDWGLTNPESIAVDRNGNVFIADTTNHRVLEYDNPAGTDVVADRVYGQANFSNKSANRGSGVPAANSLSTPRGVAIDSLGKLYVADYGNNRVLVYDKPLSSDTTADHVYGQPDLISGSANRGGVPGRDTLSGPYTVALDRSDQLYVADHNNNRVLVFFINPYNNDIQADRVLGQPDFSLTNANHGFGGPVANSLAGPAGVALDEQNYLYVSDSNNHRILKYTLPLTMGMDASAVLGQAGFDTAVSSTTAAGLSLPGGLAVDAQGGLYVADRGNNRVLRYASPQTSGQSAAMLFGQGNYNSKLVNQGAGTPSATSLSLPWGVTVDAHGNLYVADANNQRVLKYDSPVANIKPLLSSLNPAPVAAGSLTFILTVNGSGFVSGAQVKWNGASRVTAYVNSTQLTAIINASDLAGGGPFPVTVLNPAPGGGLSSITNLSLYTRNRFDRAADEVFGQPNFSSGALANSLLPGLSSRLYEPQGVAMDGQTGRLFVADESFNRVLSWPNAAARANGQAADMVFGQPDLNSTGYNTGGISASTLSNPTNLALDRHGNLYVTDLGNQRVLVYLAPLTSSKAASLVFGQGGSFASNTPNNGGISQNSLLNPEGVAIDSQGNVYIADDSNNRVLEYNTPLVSGVSADRVIGQADFTSGAPNRGGSPSANSLAGPTDLVIDAQDNLFVGDGDNNRVLEFYNPLTTDRIADIVLGQRDFIANSQNLDGGTSASASGLNFPYYLTLDRWGSLYVVDNGNARVLKYLAPFVTGAPAVLAFGQPDLVSNTPNNGGISASSFDGVSGIAVDSSDHLFVGDSKNARVLEFDTYWQKTMLPMVRR